MNQREELNSLIKRGRRRIIGSIFLVFLLIFVLIVIFIRTGNKKNSVNTHSSEHNRLNINWHVKQKNIKNDLQKEQTSKEKILTNVVSLNFPLYFYYSGLMAEFLNNEKLDLFFTSSNNNFSNLFSNDVSITPNKDINIVTNIKNPIKHQNSKKKTYKKTYKKLTPQEILDGKTNVNSRYTNTSSNSSFIIQTGAFFNKNKALSQINTLNQHKINANLLVVNTTKGELNRVRIGPFKIKSQAFEVLKQLKSINIDAIMVPQ